MPYRFKSGDKTVEKGLRRIAQEQIERGLDELDDPDLTLHDTVHQVRKRCKKLRGLVRLVRPGFDDYSDENAAFRDAARPLSELRDRESLIETFDKLAARNGVNGRRFAPIRRRLVELRDTAAVQPHVDTALEAMRAALKDARDRTDDWSLDKPGRKSIRKGLKKTFGRARKAMDQAVMSRSPEDMHEWRKRVKYHWYHARLMTGIFGEKMEAHVEATDRLADLLGDHHDLAVFCDELESERMKALPADERAALADHARRFQTELEEEAVLLGARLFAEKKSAIADRWGSWWQVWRAEAA